MKLKDLDIGDYFRISSPVTAYEQEAKFEVLYYFGIDWICCRDQFGKRINLCKYNNIIKVGENKMKVEMGKKYKLQSGEDITILTTERYPNAEPAVIGLRYNGEILAIFSDGTYRDFTNKNRTLIEVLPFKDEDQVLIKMCGHWHRSYYAFYKNGTHYVYADKMSKFTSKGVVEEAYCIEHYSEQLEAENNK